MKIVITGSLGNISKPLTESLVHNGHSVTVISSNPEKRSAIQNSGATAAIGSLDDAGFLTATFTDAHAVYAMVPPNFAEIDQMAYYRRIGGNYKEAVEKSGVKRLVYLSSVGAHLDKGTGFILGAHHVENMLNEVSGISLTHLRPAYFYYNLYNFTDMIKNAGFIGTNFGGDDKMALASPKDIAVAAAEELVKTTAANVRYVASDERTASEVAAVLGTAIGKPDMKWMTFSDDETQSALEQKGIPAGLATNFVEIGSSLHRGALLGDYEKNKPVAMGKVKIEDFAKEFADSYQQGYQSGH